MNEIIQSFWRADDAQAREPKMTDLEKICEAHRLLQCVRDNFEPDPFLDLDCAIVFVEKVRNQIERREELEREKGYQDARQYDFPEAFS